MITNFPIVLIDYWENFYNFATEMTKDNKDILLRLLQQHNDIEQFIRSTTEKVVDKSDLKQQMVDKWSIKPSLADKLVDKGK